MTPFGRLAGGALAALALASGLIIYALGDSLNFFYSPSDLRAADETPTGGFRLGGLVVEGSLQVDAAMVARFDITDGAEVVTITYDQQAHGQLPDLFREGQGVIIEGRLADGTGMAVDADRVLAKHDENYMPPEVVDALKRTGEWHGDEPDAGATYE